MSDKHFLLSVLIFQEPANRDVWIAQALEHDIAAYGADVESAKRALERTLDGYAILGERLHRDPFAALRPAPDVFWTIWRTLTSKTTPALEPLTTLAAFLAPAVSYEPLSTSH